MARRNTSAVGANGHLTTSVGQYAVETGPPPAATAAHLTLTGPACEQGNRGQVGRQEWRARNLP